MSKMMAFHDHLITWEEDCKPEGTHSFHMERTSVQMISLNTLSHIDTGNQELNNCISGCCLSNSSKKSFYAYTMHM